jgi:hypothetical protein
LIGRMSLCRLIGGSRFERFAGYWRKGFVCGPVAFSMMFGDAGG